MGRAAILVARAVFPQTIERLRRHFEVDAGHVVVAVLSALAAEGVASADEVRAAIARHGIDPDAVDPVTA